MKLTDERLISIADGVLPFPSECEEMAVELRVARIRIAELKQEMGRREKEQGMEMKMLCEECEYYVEQHCAGNADCCLIRQSSRKNYQLCPWWFRRECGEHDARDCAECPKAAAGEGGEG